MDWNWYACLVFHFLFRGMPSCYYPFSALLIEFHYWFSFFSVFVKSHLFYIAGNSWRSSQNSLFVTVDGSGMLLCWFSKEDVLFTSGTIHCFPAIFYQKKKQIYFHGYYHDFNQFSFWISSFVCCIFMLNYHPFNMVLFCLKKPQRFFFLWQITLAAPVVLYLYRASSCFWNYLSAPNSTPK